MSNIGQFVIVSVTLVALMASAYFIARYEHAHRQTIPFLTGEYRVSGIVYFENEKEEVQSDTIQNLMASIMVYTDTSLYINFPWRQPVQGSFIYQPSASEANYYFSSIYGNRDRILFSKSNTDMVEMYFNNQWGLFYLTAEKIRE